MKKKVSPSALNSLKTALSKIYWYKNDLRSFLNNTLVNKSIMCSVDWTQPKYVCCSNIIDKMALNQDVFMEDIMSLFYEVSQINDFTHLNCIKDPTKVKEAVESVNALKKITASFFTKKDEEVLNEKKRQAYVESIEIKKAEMEKLENLKNKFNELILNKNHQLRGYAFEKFLNELFEYYDMIPRPSFKVEGEQIDGSFTFDSTDYLLEAKWTQNTIDVSEILSFSGKVGGKLKNTLGLFVSVNGFSTTITENKKTFNSIICMDGNDLIQILDNKITLDKVLFLKRRRASDTGESYHRIDFI